jgi:membrane protease YdiL (CAAX protease family)
MDSTEPPKKKLKTRKFFAKKTGFGPVSAILVALGAYLGSQLLAGIFIGLYAAQRNLNEAQISDLVENSVGWQFAFILIVEVLTLGILWWFMRGRRIRLSDIGLGRKPDLSDAGKGIVTFGIYFVLLIMIMGLLQLFVPSINLEQEQQIGFEAAKGAGSLLLVFISLVILPPIVEEIVVRGFMFSGLRKGMGVVAAALIASLLFAVAHLQLGSGAPPLWVAAVDTFVLSIILIMLRLRTGALWAGMLVHGLKNGLAFMVLFVL